MNSKAQPKPPGTARAPASGRAAGPARPPRTRQRPQRSGIRSGAPLAPWSRAEKARFLEALSQSGQLQVAVRFSGRTRASAFAERLRDPAFALAWDEALDCEFEMLETRLIARALDSASPDPQPVRMSADMLAADRLALRILAQCRPPAPRPAAPRGSSGSADGAAGARAAAPPADPATVRARIDALFEEVARRIGTAEAKPAGRG